MAKLFIRIGPRTCIPVTRSMKEPVIGVSISQRLGNEFNIGERRLKISDDRPDAPAIDACAGIQGDAGERENISSELGGCTESGGAANLPKYVPVSQTIVNSVANWYSYRFLFAGEHGMTAHSNVDPESFQRLLSNAFAVQESGMDAESLTAIVELQQAIATGEADVDRAMDLIAVRARNVANATGIAIGLLKGDQLVYRAGSGSGVTYVGQHAMATLCVAGHSAASGEILRVENAQTDRRIEAAICRQFGAHSLLILPIYHDGTMAGVLDVLFDEAHAFQHREVLTYRLMAALVGEAMSYAARPEQKKAQAADLSTMRQSIRLARPQREEALNDRASVPAAATNRAIYQAFGTFMARAGRLPALTHSAWAVLKRAKCVPWYKGRWETAVGVAAMLVIACWIGFRDRRPASPLGVSGLQGSNAPRQQMPFAPAKRVLE